MTITNEQEWVQLLTDLALRLNQECGTRQNGASHDEYAGFSYDEGALCSAIAAPFQSVFGAPRYESVYDRAAALMAHIAKAHAFRDGNKRTALKLSLVYLTMRGIRVVPPSAELGAQLVEKCVLANGNQFEQVVVETSTLLIAWTVPDQIAREHRRNAQG